MKRNKNRNLYSKKSNGKIKNPGASSPKEIKEEMLGYETRQLVCIIKKA